MEQVKQKPGRPRGAVYPRRLPVYETDEGIQLVQELARRRGTSAAALVRQLVREEAARAGITSPPSVTPERREAAREHFRQLLDKARSGPASQLTPREIEREVALAREEIREKRRAGRH